MVIGILNSGVHIVMYFYYLVAALGPQYQKYLWWKKYMTTIQLVQFVLIMLYMITVSLKGCNMPRTLTFFFMANTLIFLYLFGSFYVRTYNRKQMQNGKGQMAASAALQAAGGFGCTVRPMPSYSKANDYKRSLMVDSNNNLKEQNGAIYESQMISKPLKSDKFE